MRIDDGYIFIKGIKMRAFHGVSPQERLTGNDFSIDVRVGCSMEQAMRTDSLDDTPNYADVYDIVKQEMQVPSKLLEHVAGRIAEHIFNDIRQAQTIDLTITKINPPMGACCDGAGVEVHLHRTKQ